MGKMNRIDSELLADDWFGAEPDNAPKSIPVRQESWKEFRVLGRWVGWLSGCFVPSTIGRTAIVVSTLLMGAALYSALMGSETNRFPSRWIAGLDFFPVMLIIFSVVLVSRTRTRQQLLVLLSAGLVALFVVLNLCFNTPAGIPRLATLKDNSAVLASLGIFSLVSSLTVRIGFSRFGDAYVQRLLAGRAIYYLSLGVIFMACVVSNLFGTGTFEPFVISSPAAVTITNIFCWLLVVLTPLWLGLRAPSKWRLISLTTAGYFAIYAASYLVTNNDFFFRIWANIGLYLFTLITIVLPMYVPPATAVARKTGWRKSLAIIGWAPISFAAVAVLSIVLLFDIEELIVSRGANWGQAYYLKRVKGAARIQSTWPRGYVAFMTIPEKASPDCLKEIEFAKAGVRGLYLSHLSPQIELSAVEGPFGLVGINDSTINLRQLETLLEKSPLVDLNHVTIEGSSADNRSANYLTTNIHVSRGSEGEVAKLIKVIREITTDGHPLPAIAIANQELNVEDWRALIEYSRQEGCTSYVDLNRTSYVDLNSQDKASIKTLIPGELRAPRDAKLNVYFHFGIGAFNLENLPNLVNGSSVALYFSLNNSESNWEDSDFKNAMWIAYDSSWATWGQKFSDVFEGPLKRFGEPKLSTQSIGRLYLDFSPPPETGTMLFVPQMNYLERIDPRDFSNLQVLAIDPSWIRYEAPAIQQKPPSWPTDWGAKSFTKMESLYLGPGEIADYGFLATMPTLKLLMIHGTIRDPAAMGSFRQAIGKLTKLETVILDGVVDRPLAAMISKLPSVTKVHLNSLGNSDDEIASITALFSKNVVGETQEVAEQFIPETFIEHRKRVMQKLDKLYPPSTGK